MKKPNLTLKRFSPNSENMPEKKKSLEYKLKTRTCFEIN
jgi:hypothetical protein